MTISIVDLATGQFKHNTGEPYLRDPQGTLRPATKLPEFGWFEFIPANNTPPENKKAGGTFYDVDLANGTVSERIEWIDMTAEEIKVKTNAALDAQIDSLERQALLPRITRDMHKMATLKTATELGITEAQLLDENDPAYSPGYARFKAFDDQIAALRAQRL